jgi:methylmalonyl-CoA/ethylmalonyl-CoA epimerase
VTPIRRLDHVAIVVRDTEAALRNYRDRFGLEVVHSEVLESPPVRLTYLDCGNAFLQLVEPLADSPVAQWLVDHGEGLHHVGFGADDPLAAAAELAPDGAPAPAQGTGRGRVSSFVPGEPPNGARLEFTEFVYREDVVDSPGWLGRDADRAVVGE